MNNDLGIDHDDCNVREFNVEEAARASNERSITGNIEAQYVVSRPRTQPVHASSSDDFSDAIVIVDSTPIIMRVKNIFYNKKLLNTISIIMP